MKSREVGACSLFPDPAVQLQTQAWLAFSLQTRFSSARGKVNPEHGFSPRALQVLPGAGAGGGGGRGVGKGRRSLGPQDTVPHGKHPAAGVKIGDDTS